MKTIEILVVEDDAISACVFIKVLERNGYQVSHVQTGSDAMVLLKSDRYALAVMDFHLPDMNGFELAKKIRNEDRVKGTLTPLLANSADVINCTLEKCLEAGFDHFISKPIDLEMFIKTVSKLVQEDSATCIDI